VKTGERREAAGAYLRTDLPVLFEDEDAKPAVHEAFGTAQAGGSRSDDYDIEAVFHINATDPSRSACGPQSTSFDDRVPCLESRFFQLLDNFDRRSFLIVEKNSIGLARIIELDDAIVLLEDRTYPLPLGSGPATLNIDLHASILGQSRSAAQEGGDQKDA
jgi:hypothetical protein